MKIAIIGATSFFRKTLRSVLAQDSECEVSLLSRKEPEDKRAGETWFVYNYPQVSIDYEEIASCDVVYYCAGAGIQPKHSDAEQVIYEMNAFEPIRLFNALKSLEYKRKAGNIRVLF